MALFFTDVMAVLRFEALFWSTTLVELFKLHGWFAIIPAAFIGKTVVDIFGAAFRLLRG